ncbi:unnamed protein product, partial [Strongylus vulgaris]
VIFSVLAFVAGLVILWLGRKAANAFYNWRISRKRQGLDSLVARKKSLLETVKETETFKVIMPRQNLRADQVQSAVSQMNDRPIVTNGSNPPVKKLHTKSFESLPAAETRFSDILLLLSFLCKAEMSTAGVEEMGPVRSLPPRPRLKPIRPFQRESTTVVDKMVDYFFGDGPSQRLALICSNCHGHNGMALPAEYDYLAFVCFICGHFNPAKKFRPSHYSSPGPTPPRNVKMNASMQPASSNSSKRQGNGIEEVDEKEPKESSHDSIREEQVHPELSSH